MLVMNDQVINNTLQKIGNVTGWLGWQTNVLSNNHITMLGYSGNLDNGLKMAQTNAQTFLWHGNAKWGKRRPLDSGLWCAAGRGTTSGFRG